MGPNKTHIMIFAPLSCWSSRTVAPPLPRMIPTSASGTGSSPWTMHPAPPPLAPLLCPCCCFCCRDPGEHVDGGASPGGELRFMPSNMPERAEASHPCELLLPPTIPP